MVSRLGALVSRLSARYLPDPFVIAVLLSLVTLILALTFGSFPGKQPGVPPLTHLLTEWRGEKGLWSFLAFGMQMCLVLVSGHALAASEPVSRALRAIAARATSTASGAALTCLVGCLLSLVNWGLGLMAGALLAREVGRSLGARSIPHHYPLIVAAGFAGFLPWHGGLSASGPLSMTSPESMAKVLKKPEIIEKLGAAGFPDGIPLSQTIFSPLNLVVTLGLIILAPLCLALLAPRRPEEMTPIDARLAGSFGAESHQPRMAVDAAGTPDAAPDSGLGPRLDNSRAINIILAVGLIAAAAAYLFSTGAAQFGTRLQRMGLNEINLVAIAAGLLLHSSPRSYLAAIEDGARGCAGIILQFPIYGGIVALLTASGLDIQIARAFEAAATERTLPLLTFLCAGVINMFVPSGGGQWGVQGPIALETALTMGVPPSKMVMAVAYGDQVTNMLQVFWALPLLAITGARARDIVGYTTVVMVVALVWVGAVLLVM